MNADRGTEHPGERWSGSNASKESGDGADERRRLDEERARMHARTRELEALKTKFFANLSHELRTPLALILGPAERLLHANSLSENDRHDLEVILRNARTLLRHVNDLLDVSRVEAGKMRPEYAECDISRLLRMVAGHFDGMAQERAIKYAVDVPERLIAQVDPDQLQRIVLNLLSNAFKFTPERGVIRCSATRRGDLTLRIEIADSGPGVPPINVSSCSSASADRRQRTRRRGHRARPGDCPRFHLAASRQHHARRRARGRRAAGRRASAARAGGPLLRPVDDSAVIAARDGARGARRPRAATARDAARAGPSDRPLVLVIEDNPDMNRFVAQTFGPELPRDLRVRRREGIARRPSSCAPIWW